MSQIQPPTPYPALPRGWKLRRLGIRVGIPILLFLLVVAEAILLGKELYIFAAALVGIPALLLALEFAMQRHDLFPILVLIAALFIPLSFSTGRSSRLVLSLVLATGFLALWVFQMFTDRQFRIRSTPVNLPAYLFMLAVVVSLVWGMVFRDPALNVWGSFPLVQAASTLLIVISIAVVLLTGNLVTEPKMLKWMVGLFLAAGVLGILDNFLPFIKLPVNTRGLFAMWVVSISFSLAIFHRKLAPWVRIAFMVLAFSWVYWGYGLNVSWLAGWVPVIAVIMMIGFFRSPKLAVGMLILLALVVVLSWDYLSQVIDLENRISGTTRLAAWGMNWRITKDHLLFGTGPAGYAIYYMTYFPNQAMATHNNYLDMLAQTGIVGFGLMMWFFIRLLWMGWRLLRRLRGRGDFFEALAAACLAGTLGGLMMMFFGDWLFPFAYTQTIAGFDYSVYNWIFMGVILSLEKMTTPVEGAAG